ncbi:MAG: T9SS type A sorting domain-containing protein [bacterium]|nr:T9SS type A sorting domain-containing protein [bacterium]
MRRLGIILMLLCAAVAFASSGGSTPAATTGEDRSPVVALDDQCVIDHYTNGYGSQTGQTQYPGGAQNFRLAMFCFTTSGCASLPDTFCTYCTDVNHSLNENPYCVEVDECVVDNAYPTVIPALAYVLSNYDVVDAQTDRIKQLAIWKLSMDRSGSPNNGIPFVHINDGRGYPNVGDAPVFPYVNTIFNTDPLNTDPANALVLDALGYDLALTPTFAKNVVNCGDELLVATDPVVIEGGVATICATITLSRGAHAINDLNNTSVSGVWVSLADLNGNGTLSTTGAFTDALGQVHVCITQAVDNSYQDVRLQVCSEGLWPRKLEPCADNNGQSQVLVNADGCTVCTIVDLPGDNWLPVELAGFTAVAAANGISVDWATRSEARLDRFELVRNGVVIAQVAASNSAAGSSYSFLDVNVDGGVTYTYELVCLALDGSRDLMATASATPQGGPTVISNFALHQNFPNPFNPETSISFELAEAATVMLTVFNMNGQVVSTLLNGELNAGSHTVNFDGANLTSGVYLYRLTAGSYSATMKMVLMK